MAVDYNIPLQTQLDYMMYELQGPESRTMDAFKSAGAITPQEYAELFEQKYERADGHGMGRRKQYALEVFRAAGTDAFNNLPQNAQTAFNYFKGKGFTDEQAAGIVGNLMTESYAQIDPNAYNPAGGGMGAYGIAQFRGSRLKGLLDFAGQQGDTSMDQTVGMPLQARMKEPEKKGGIRGLLDFASERNPQTGLSRFEQFAAALDPLIMPEMRAGEGIRQRGAMRVQNERTNKTIEWLKKNGYPEIAAAVEANPQSAANVMSAILSQQVAQPKQDATSAMKNYEFLVSRGVPQDQAMERAFGKGGTVVKVGDDMKIVGDQVLVQDPSSPSGVRFVPIPGGKTALAEQAAEEQKGAAETQAQQKEAVVASSIDYLVGKLDKGGLFNLPEAGIVGNLLSRLGVNQEAVDFRNELSTLQAITAFDRLQQMREASKTGGALGAVSERELDLLINAYGNIQQSTSEKRLRENLLTIKRIMTKIENDPVASSFYYNTATPVTEQSGGTTVGEPY